MAQCCWPALSTAFCLIWAPEADQWRLADCAVNTYLAYLPVFFPAPDLSANPAYRKLLDLDP